MGDATQGFVGTQDDVIPARVGAFMLDHVLSFLAALLLGFGMAFLTRGSRAAIILGVTLGFLGYFTLLEWLFGKTIGKKLAGIVVVDRNGGSLTLRQALIRNLLRFVDGFLSYAVGLVVMLISDDVQRFGDHAAGTLVVRARR